MTDDQINELRLRIEELETQDADFARRSNLLLDEILLTRDQVDSNARSIDSLTQVTSENRRDIDQLAQRTGELAQSISELRQSQQILTFAVSQVAESVSILRQTQQGFVEQAVADRRQMLENQAEIRRIWEYLLSQHPNGRGGQSEG